MIGMEVNRQVEIPGYTITEKIREGSQVAIYRAHDGLDHSVIVKLLDREYPHPRDVARFRREYELTKGLEIDGIVKPLDLVEIDNSVAIIFEDSGGISLKQYLDGKAIALDSFFSLAPQLVRILGEIHQQRVIHKDIKPDNIIIDGQGEVVQLTDFGIATRLPQTRQQDPLSLLEGTLAYLPPEQTGRMNRVVDYRSDFYALGVTFYEMLAGRLPYYSADPMDLVHYQIAGQPPPLPSVNDAVPAALDAVVARLLAKNAEDRYQSTKGLLYDLEQCGQAHSRGAVLADFEPGSHDISSRFQIPEKLYGRAAEVGRLLQAFHQVREGEGYLLLVAGQSGIGKSALVNEIQRPVVESRGQFISGKFDQFKRNVPYDSLIQACSKLVKNLLARSDEEVAAWKERLLEAVGPNGQVIIDVVPELRLIIGEQPPPPSVTPAERRNRFNRVFLRLFQAFAAADHPLVLFLDDLQWADTPSLKLVELLITDPRSTHLLLILCYRDNEVDPAHPLSHSLFEIQKLGIRLNRLTVGPLSRSHVVELLEDTLAPWQTSVMELAGICIEKTRGNPFFLNQFLLQLAHDGHVNFDEAVGKWTWDINAIRKLQMTDNVVEFVAAKLGTLGEATQGVLQLASTIGNQFDMERLTIISEQGPEDVMAILWPALEEGLVVPLNEDYQFAEEAGGASFRFLHDRVQQAASSLIDADQRSSLQGKVGRLLLESATDEQLETWRFDIVNHLNRDRDRARGKQRLQLVGLNLEAGRKAKVAAAFEPAFAYLQTGVELAPAGLWDDDYDTMLGLHVDGAEAAYLSGHFDQMEAWSDAVVEHAASVLDQVPVYEVRIQAYMAQDTRLKAVKVAEEVLTLLDVRFPPHPNKWHLWWGLRRARRLVARGEVANLIELAEMEDPHHLAAVRILSRVLSATYQARPRLSLLIVIKLMELLVKHGNTPGGAYGYANYGLVLCGMGQIQRGNEFAELALALLDHYDAPEFRASTFEIIYGFIVHWQTHLQETQGPLLEGYRVGLETGDFEYAAYDAAIYCMHGCYLGSPLKALQEEMATYSQSLAGLHQVTASHYLEVMRQTVANLRGEAEDPVHLIGAYYDEKKMIPRHEETNDRTALFILYLNKLYLALLFRDEIEATASARKAKKYLGSAVATLGFPLYFFYNSLLRLRLYPDLSAQEQKVTLKKVDHSIGKLRVWAEHAPMNHRHKYLLVLAERERLLGHPGQAAEYYDDASSGARKNGYLHEEALINELAGEFYLLRGKSRLARFHLLDALQAYTTWGASAKVAHLEGLHPQLLRGRQGPGTRTLPTSTSLQRTGVMDYISVIKATQTISAELALAPLLRNLLQVAVENAGANRGLLLLPKRDELVIEVEAGLDLPAANLLDSIPVEGSERLPSAVAHYVMRSGETVILSNPAEMPEYATNDYFQTIRPRSVLCLPIMRGDHLVAILYLENRLASDAFSAGGDRLETLELLSSQAAISVENALLFQELEERVQQRTEQLQDTHQQLHQASRAKSAFLANMSHELRTPLNAIIGYSELIQEVMHDRNEDPGQLQDLSRIQGSARHLLTLINDILDLSKIEAGKMDIVNTVVDVQQLITDVTTTIRPLLEKNGNQLQVTLPDPSGSTFTDATRLSQCLLNLLSNSSKFTENGTIYLRVTREANGEDRWIHYEVRDTGIGMTEEQVTHLFQDYTQSDPSITKKYGGTGLGLVISRMLCKLMGGDITASSEMEKGSTFVIRLPDRTPPG